MKLPQLKIGDISLKLPIIQGGMGIGVSLSKLASAIANEGGMGVISAAQVGYKEPDFSLKPMEANVRALSNEIKTAKELSPKGFIGVNIMVAMKNYADMVKTAIEAKVDAIISGAGLPTELPAIAGDSTVKLIPIVSSLRAAKIIIKKWTKKHNRYPDAIIVEGPLAGGHLGFSVDDLNKDIDVNDIVHSISQYLKEIEKDIPVIAAGGIYTGQDIATALSKGASGVQMSTRFVTTTECDAHIDYKKAYVNASKEDIVIVKSPVGMPGRALNNAFIKSLTASDKEDITKCYNCLRNCDPKETPYCITDKLIKAVEGDVDNGLVFVGENAWKNTEIKSISSVVKDIKDEFENTCI